MRLKASGYFMFGIFSQPEDRLEAVTASAASCMLWEKEVTEWVLQWIVAGQTDDRVASGPGRVSSRRQQW